MPDVQIFFSDMQKKSEKTGDPVFRSGKPAMRRTEFTEGVKKKRI